jgi:hypothetical protein
MHRKGNAMAKKKHAAKTKRPPAKKKDSVSAACEAESIRREWMTLSGMDKAEITYWLENDPPTDPSAEEAQLAACRKLKAATPSTKELSQISTRY